MKSLIKWTLVCVMLGIIIGETLILTGSVENPVNRYQSSVPDKFLASRQEQKIDSNFVTVSSCDGSESYRIPTVQLEYNKKTKIINIHEMFTDRDLRFDGNKYRAEVQGDLVNTLYGCESSVLDYVRNSMTQMMNK